MSNDRAATSAAAPDPVVSTAAAAPPDEPIVVVERFMARLAGDLLGAIADEAGDELTWAFPPSLTNGVVWSGKERVIKRLGPVLEKFDQPTMKIVRRGATVHSGDDVAVEFDLTATSSSGDAYANTYVFFFTVVGGKIVSVREYMDTSVVLKLMGV